MDYSILGKTALKVSRIGLGCEWLNNQPRELVHAVINNAFDQGINYFDLVYNFEPFLQNIRHAIKDLNRENLILTHHLGSGEHEGKYRKTRSLGKIIRNFDRYTNILGTDYADIGMVHFVMNEKQFEQCCQENGVFDLAREFQELGRIQFIGMSTHDANVAIQAAQKGVCDVIMFQINLANNGMENRNRALAICAQHNVGVIAMKPFAGGRLLMQGSVNIAGYQRGSKGLKKTIKTSISPIQCLHYVLSQPGLAIALPGVKNLGELNQVLAYNSASDEEKDYAEVLKSFKEYREGQCVYCNHCSPCPQKIDIGEVFRLYDRALYTNVESVRMQYSMLESKASDCVKCGECVSRCPFNVPILQKMEKSINLFGL
ncbi:MAG: aldo/keto reductase [Candidatus Lokiarchaeota archaeon]|nr:aldo/keto reductase [Candidatus Lokiarchaeota archaeon]